MLKAREHAGRAVTLRCSLLPRRFGVDAIILFYDITTLAVAMGMPFVLKPEQGPVPDRPIRTLADVDRLEAEPEPERFRHIRELLTLVKKELQGELPVLVFAGAPFSVHGRREADGSVSTWIANPKGGLAQQGKATFK